MSENWVCCVEKSGVIFPQFLACFMYLHGESNGKTIGFGDNIHLSAIPWQQKNGMYCRTSSTPDAEASKFTWNHVEKKPEKTIF